MVLHSGMRKVFICSIMLNKSALLVVGEVRSIAALIMAPVSVCESDSGAAFTTRLVGSTEEASGSLPVLEKRTIFHRHIKSVSSP